MPHPGCCHVSSWLEVNTIVNQCPLGIKLKVRQLLCLHSQALPDTKFIAFTVPCVEHEPYIPLLCFYFHHRCIIAFKHYYSDSGVEDMQPRIRKMNIKFHERGLREKGEVPSLSSLNKGTRLPLQC